MTCLFTSFLSLVMMPALSSHKKFVLSVPVGVTRLFSPTRPCLGVRVYACYRNFFKFQNCSVRVSTLKLLLVACEAGATRGGGGGRGNHGARWGGGETK